MAETTKLVHNLEYTCRTCMKTSSKQNLTPLFIGELGCLNAHPEVLEEIAFFGLEFNENDGLPQILCVDCLEKIRDIREFRKRCEDVQDMLKIYFIGSKDIKAEKTDDVEIEFVDVDIKNESETLQDTESLENFDYVQDSEQYSDSDSMSDDENNTDQDICKIEYENETKCKICDEEFETFVDLENHLKSVHKNDSDIKCEQCNRTYKSKQHLKRHILRIHTKADFECSICKKKFTNNFRFKYHMASHASKKKHQCQYCEKSFLQSNHKKIHEMSHTGERPYLCCFCGKDFRYESRYKEHLVRYHRDQDIRDIVGDALMQKEFKPVRSWVPRNKNGNERSKEDVSSDDNDAELNENDSSQYSCKNCHKNFGSLIRLNKHIKCCKQRKNVGCDICTLQFESEVLYQNHKESHPIDSLPFCPICSQTFENAEKRDDHIVSTHDIRENSRCDICHKLSMSKLKLLRHKIRIHPIGDYECPVCNDEKFSYYHLYNIHMRKHIKNFKCNYCDKLFYSQYKVVLHERVHTGEQPHLCNVCGMTFRNISDLNQHLDCHNDQKNFKCSECDEDFLTRKKLSSHMQRWHKSKREPCDVCGKVFRVRQLAIHKYNAHNGEKPPSQVADRSYPFNCPVCSKGFLAASSLLAHSKVHMNDRKHVCHDCGARYKRADHLQLHIKRAHLNVKNHSCDVCGKKFLEKCALKGHMVVHLKTRPFKCSECPCDFKTNRSLQTHIRTHTGESPHCCGICEMRFPNRRLLVLHTMTHSQEQIKEIEVVVANAVGAVETNDDINLNYMQYS